MTTVNIALQRARHALVETSDAPDLDASRLLLHVLGKSDASWLAAHPEVQLSAAQDRALEDAVRERQNGKPLAYILGSWEFYGREFLVDERVLIPRPATEQLVAQALEIISDMNKKIGRPVVLADIGTGSGCIAITLLLESPTVERVYATDISSDALEVAHHNAERYEVHNRIEFLQGSMLEPFDSAQGKPLTTIDLIVSNPPYIPSSELDNPSQRPETTGLVYEPRHALDGGSDGQDFTQILMKTAIPAVIEATGGKIVRNPAFAKATLD